MKAKVVTAHHTLMEYLSAEGLQISNVDNKVVITYKQTTIEANKYQPFIRLMSALHVRVEALNGLIILVDESTGKRLEWSQGTVMR